MLTERLLREIEEARSGYESQPYKHPVYRLNETEWFSVAARELRKENQEAPQATLAEMLDVLTKHTEHLADREARQIERTMDALGIEHASLTEKALAELVQSWPWSSGAPFHGSTKDMAPMLLDEITKQPGKKPNGVELRELYQWARESIDALPTEKPRATLGWVSDEHYGPMAVYLSGLSNNADAPPIHDRHLLALYVATVPESVRYARSFTLELARVAEGDRERYLLEHVAPQALKACKSDATQEAIDALSLAVRQHARKWRETLTLPVPKDTASADSLAIELYEHFAQYAEKHGSEGKENAADYRKKASERTSKTTAEKWGPWRSDGDTVPRWLLGLACVAWESTTKRQVINRPAVTISIHEDLTNVHSRSHVLENKNGQRALTFPDRDSYAVILSPTPSMENTMLDELVTRGASLLGSVYAHRLLRFEIVTAHEQALRHDADPRLIRIDGGWSVLAHDTLKIKNKSAADDLKAIAYAQQAVRLPLPNGGFQNGLITLRDAPGQGRRKGSIGITLCEMLLPNFVHELIGNGRETREHRRLVPVLRELPPMLGRTNEQGAQATLSMRVMQRLRTHARELAQTGAVTITPDQWTEDADAAKLPRAMLPRVLDRWTQDGDDGPAFLRTPSPGAFTLGEAHAAELAFVVSAGWKEITGSEAGQRSSAKREAKLQRLGTRKKSR